MKEIKSNKISKREILCLYTIIFKNINKYNAMATIIYNSEINDKTLYT